MGKFLRLVLLFSIVLSGFNIRAQGQVTVIKGLVSDEKGETIPGVTVTVKGTTNSGAITDVNGQYSIQAPANGTLVFKFIGMKTQEVAVNGRTSISLTLHPLNTTLSEVNVVAIGYGTQKKQDINGAISSVSAQQIADIPQPSIDQMLQGKAAGVTITQNSGGPGSATSVHIRGITSFGQSEPLYVIDGVPVQGDASNSSTSGRSVQLTRTGGGQEETGVSPLALLNPNDIESISFLKDASASAIYGNRAANGVVIITTKKGKAGTAHINYDGFFGIQQQGKFLKMMNLQQYASLENIIADSYGVARRGEFADPGILGPGTNWQDAIFRTAYEQSHSVSVSGATPTMDYYISGGYFKQDGTILGSNFDRYSFLIKANGQVKPWFKLGGNVQGSRSNQNVGLADNTGIVYNALLSAPDMPVRNPDGSFAGPAISSDGTIQGGINPVAQALSLTNTLLRNNVKGGFYNDLNIVKGLSLHSEVNGDFNWSDARTFQPTYAWTAAGTNIGFINQTARLDVYTANSTYWGWNEYLNYNNTFGKHNITVLAGREVWESTWEGIPISVTGFLAGNTIQTIGLGSTLAASIPENKGSQAMESYMGRAIYTFDNKYSITASIRSDASSKFDYGHKTGYFPAVAVSWRLSDEPFMAGIKKFADNIKLRFGYGQTGNANIPNYLYGSAIQAVNTGLGTGFIVNNVANPYLTWEHVNQTNIGLDFTLLNNRIDGTIDLYDKRSSNFLFQVPLPAFLLGGTAEYSGAAVIQPPYENAGEIENKGIEFSINSRNIDTKSFKWSTTLIFSKYVNKVVSLANGVPYLVGAENTAFVNLPVTRTYPGGPVGEFYGYKVQGIIKTSAQLAYLSTHPQNVTGGTQPATVTNDRSVANSIWLGDIQYQDTNHDGKVDANDQVPLGNPNPDFTYSITNNFQYKDFELSIFLNGSYGGKVLNALKYEIEGLSGLYQNQLAEAANFWTPSNPNSNIPAPRSGIANNNLVMSDRFLESASFLRVQNVRIGYNLPAQWAQKVKMSRLKVYASGQNLYVFTKYSGLDPEVGSLNQNPTLMNVDNGRYPIPRVITFGLNAEF